MNSKNRATWVKTNNEATYPSCMAMELDPMEKHLPWWQHISEANAFLPHARFAHATGCPITQVGGLVAWASLSCYAGNTSCPCSQGFLKPYTESHECKLLCGMKFCNHKACTALSIWETDLNQEISTQKEIQSDLVACSNIIVPFNLYLFKADFSLHANTFSWNISVFQSQCNWNLVTHEVCWEEIKRKSMTDTGRKKSMLSECSIVLCPQSK
jgi:hypothetical protein